MKITLFILSSLLVVSGCKAQVEVKKDAELLSEVRLQAKEQLLDKWYPLVVDEEDGGYYSDVTNDFRIGERHDKMIVTQARHIWSNAIAAQNYPERQKYLDNAKHGFRFLRDVMWDPVEGGFFNLVTRSGEPILKPGEEKTAYGNAFAIYGLAEYYGASGNEDALELAKRTFHWLEDKAHDSLHNGYFNTLDVKGDPIERSARWPSTSDVGYKDQNSSIHLLEAFTSLYQVWPDELLRERLRELLGLIRDTITTEKGYMNLFFEPDWTPVSFRDSSLVDIKKHYYLDHVSFGHDVETAYLMIEATHALGLENDTLTLKVGKKMVDHALRTGWDTEKGGFYDGGYYLKGEDQISILNAKKNWWAQAEGLNTLLIMSRYFPEDKMEYREHFDKLWEYTRTYIMDQENGGWYEWGIDVTPEARDDLKGHIWKASYHDLRALQNIIKELEEGNVE